MSRMRTAMPLAEVVGSVLKWAMVCGLFAWIFWLLLEKDE